MGKDIEAQGSIIMEDTSYLIQLTGYDEELKEPVYYWYAEDAAGKGMHDIYDFNTGELASPANKSTEEWFVDAIKGIDDL